MNNRSIFAATAILLVIGPVPTYSAVQIRVSQDISLSSSDPGTNQNNPGHPFLWIGDNSGSRDFQGMFGFDVTAVTSLLGSGDTLIINNLTFFAYNNFDGGDGFVDIALGNTDIWDDDVVTWNSSADNHGATIDSVFLNAADVGNYKSWDVTSIGASPLVDNGYLTFYLYIYPDPDPNGSNWHDFENEEYSSSDNAAYISIDYTISHTSAAVPEAGSLAIWGLLGLTFSIAARFRHRHGT